MPDGYCGTSGRAWEGRRLIRWWSLRPEGGGRRAEERSARPADTESLLSSIKARISPAHSGCSLAGLDGLIVPRKAPPLDREGKLARACALHECLHEFHATSCISLLFLTLFSYSSAYSRYVLSFASITIAYPFLLRPLTMTAELALIACADVGTIIRKDRSDLPGSPS